VRMDAILKRAIQLLLEVPGSTFHDLYRMFTDNYFLHQLVESVSDEGLRVFWKTVWPKYPHPVTEEPLVTRLSEFDSNKSLRVITSTLSSLNFSELIAKKKIFIANISKGAIGLDTSPILGTLLVSQYQLAGFRQASLPPNRRVPCYLYIDEFHNFKTSAFNEIIIESRKFKLCLTLANQKLDDLDQATRGTADACETVIFFRLVADDARKFGKSVGAYGQESLMNLNDRTAIIRPGRPSDSKLFAVKAPPRPPLGFRNEIIEHVRKTYASTAVTKRFPPAKPRGVKDDDDSVEPGLSPE
jgi:DNA helicase HerA-like ATPase